ncbi:CBS domain-containing protein [Spirillospora sp. CA-128828]|uniref:CBS domain-containing protein n=1 Tax=Spirillospora sp. CA-128828 TaxID=3240033 RepID=UPI003D8BF999
MITNLAEHEISGVPVVDGEGRVLGVVTEADLLRKTAAALDTRPGPKPRSGHERLDRSGPRSPRPGRP